MKTAKTASIPGTDHSGNITRAYRLPDGAWYDGVDNTLHVPVQPIDAIAQIAEALEGHDLQDTIVQEIAERLETYELCKYMTGHKN